ncbi:MAG: hypothetical protein DRJ35_03420 [Thermoprotei archaeon]|nr:MAG: hypothetical protein DRJ35_03420 [Thermoprotei archaeon]
MSTLELVEKIYKVGCELASKLGFKCNVTLEELHTYLSAPTYEEDRITLEEISSNRYLCLHEVLECSILKSYGLKITEKIFSEKNISLIYKAHLEAMKLEIFVAFNEGDKKWVKKRFEDLRSYLTDPNLPKELVTHVLELISLIERLMIKNI